MQFCIAGACYTNAVYICKVTGATYKTKSPSPAPGNYPRFKLSQMALRGKVSLIQSITERVTQVWIKLACSFYISFKEVRERDIDFA